MPDSIQPTNPDTAVPENASDLEAKVAARAAAIEAKVADKIPAPPNEIAEGFCAGLSEPKQGWGCSSFLRPVSGQVCFRAGVGEIFILVWPFLAGGYA